MRRLTLAIIATAALPLVVSAAGFVAACSSGNADVGGEDASSDALTSPSDGGLQGDALPNYDCPETAPPAASIECTGLYANLATKQVAASAQAYAPATPLWSDGAEKSRWIELPPGTQIDISDPNEWTFPVGTKVFKEFRVGGKRVETRLFQKTLANYWIRATYAWNSDDSEATISYGATVPTGDGGSWTIPTPDECDECHKGRTDRVLGFEQVGLGLPGATGLTLAQLAAQNLLTPAPTRTSLTIGDDGTGLDVAPLGWLHVNCGVTCHNDNAGASAYGAGMLLRLDPTLLDGRPVTSAFDPIRTTENVLGVSGNEDGVPRILPGHPSESAIVQLISERGMDGQMPPIASQYVDTTDVAAVVAWIQKMPAADAGEDAGEDAGPDAGEDAGVDAAPSDDAGEDSGPIDAGTDATLANDAGTPDTGAPDTGAPDATVDAGAPDAADDGASTDSGPTDAGADAHD